MLWWELRRDATVNGFLRVIYGTAALEERGRRMGQVNQVVTPANICGRLDCKGVHVEPLDCASSRILVAQCTGDWNERRSDLHRRFVPSAISGLDPLPPTAVTSTRFTPFSPSTSHVESWSKGPKRTPCLHNLIQCGAFEVLRRRSLSDRSFGDPPKHPPSPLRLTTPSPDPIQCTRGWKPSAAIALLRDEYRELNDTLISVRPLPFALVAI